MKSLKMVVIGGGSSYTPELIAGIIAHQESLPITELVLVDVPMGAEKVRINTALVKRMCLKANMSIRISMTLDRLEALQGAAFVLTQFRVGGLAAREKDETIPLQFGMIGQETTGPGGFAKALRTIPVILDIAKEMEEVCPEAWLINFTNPSGIVTEAVHKHTKIRTIGLCNVPINMHYEVAKKLEVLPSQVTCRFIGLNHLSFLTSATVNGQECIEKVVAVVPERSIEGVVKNIEKMKDMDEVAYLMKAMLSPYMQYFYFEKHMLEEELEKIQNGEGSRAYQVQLVEEELFKLYEDITLDEKPKALEKRGGARYSEAAISLLDSIYNNRGDVQVVNTLNNGAFYELPDEAVVETNCVINNDGATPLTYGKLPLSVKGLICQVKAYEQLTIEAAVTGSRTIALQALLNNPLVHDYAQAKQMLEALLEAHKSYLPKFFQEENGCIS